MLDIAIVQGFVQMILGLFPQIPTGVSQFVGSITGQLPALVQAGTDIDTFVRGQMTVVQNMIQEGRDPTQQEWDDLNETMRLELAKLNLQATPGQAP